MSIYRYKDFKLLLGLLGLKVFLLPFLYLLLPKKANITIKALFCFLQKNQARKNIFLFSLTIPNSLILTVFLNKIISIRLSFVNYTIKNIVVINMLLFYIGKLFLVNQNTLSISDSSIL